METPSQLRILSIKAEVEYPTTVFCRVRAEGEAKQGCYHGKGFNNDTVYLQLLAGEFVALDGHGQALS